MDEVAFWVGFDLVPGIGPKRIRLLLDHFGELSRAWEASAWDLSAAGLDTRCIQALQETRAKISLEREMARVERAGATILTWRDAEYPRLLRNIAASPPLLYVRGKILPRDELALAVVGTRKASTYGREVAHLLASEIARCGVTIVSGLARGIDGVAHRAALSVGGRTIAVLGSGVDVIYPSEHRDLAERIIQNGALVSEYPIGAKPVVCAEDILQELNLNMVEEFVQARETLPEAGGEALLLQHMAAEPIHVDELARATGMSIADVNSTLVMMELKGLVRHVGSMNYVAVREGRQVYRP